MLAGGAPGSTAGGFKVTTLSVLLLNMRAVFRRNAHTQCFGRRLADDVVSRAAALVTLYLVLFLCGGMTIAIADRISLGAALFTAASAIGTVGLAVSPIGELCAVSRLVLIFLMYFGRVGGLTMIFAISSGKRYAAVQFPMEQVTIG
jgi:trk system potassium uptake protein TrkH